MPTRLPVHVVEPAATHTHTAIFLHGRGDNGSDFAEELFASGISDGTGVVASETQTPAPAQAPTTTLRTRFPLWRWVFPSAPNRWSTAFQLGGAAQNVVLGGISQGAAVGLWALLGLLAPGQPGAELIPRLGAFVGVSCWLPFVSAAGKYLPGVGVDEPSKEGSIPGSNVADSTTTDSITDITITYNGCSQDFVRSMLKGARILSSIASHGIRDHPFLTTPVFLGHGTDDAYVDVSLGRQTKEVLSGMGFQVTWKEYVGAEQEGHWYKEPEELDDIARFLSAMATA
ncbi:hypothetical protein PV08_08255 [Exophiala spinifera]|uniref:Phospholipase/carboxylesterase/thioesterase domain-containing protein n=1 Tax=Exophiala spinifera TaxID=91928 RepID=A0A0D2B2F1_9EURO|nr:uncharacterized protein PV08_08255 [Exophiala spinifera]KIW13068.1 hypothetical protein PV08_08255 [Exophiala spinifera]